MNGETKGDIRSRILIRQMTVDDIPKVRELETEIFTQPWSEQIFRDELGVDGRIYVAAEVDGRLMAYAGAMVVAEDGHVTTVAVDPSARRLRLATRMILVLVEGCMLLGARHLTLEVRVSNTGAQRLYTRFGMAPVGVRKHYYKDEDALIMWATDIDTPQYKERLDEIRAALDEEPTDG